MTETSAQFIERHYGPRAARAEAQFVKVYAYNASGYRVLVGRFSGTAVEAVSAARRAAKGLRDFHAEEVG